MRSFIFDFTPMLVSENCIQQVRFIGVSGCTMLNTSTTIPSSVSGQIKTWPMCKFYLSWMNKKPLANSWMPGFFVPHVYTGEPLGKEHLVRCLSQLVGQAARPESSIVTPKRTGFFGSKKVGIFAKNWQSANWIPGIPFLMKAGKCFSPETIESGDPPYVQLKYGRSKQTKTQMWNKHIWRLLKC